MNQDNSKASNAASVASLQSMRKVYDRYFASHDYKRRYPVPNPATMQFLLQQGCAASAASILDVGCGDGRYALALLDATSARITGCDISSVALAEFAAHVQARPDAGRVQFVCGQVENMLLDMYGPHDPRHDLSMLMFGVLSHAGERPARVAMLKAICEQTRPGGRLVLTVPSFWRRWPVENLRAIWRKATHSPLAHANYGDIEYVRAIDGQDQPLFYHLYSVPRLRHELGLAGWVLQSADAESLLPEWLITQYPWAARLDGMLRPLLPAALGYGIRAVALPKLNSAEGSVS